jgi:thiol-disulfide isomerase/thioredoxin
MSAFVRGPLLLTLLLVLAPVGLASEPLVVPVFDEEMSLTRYVAEGDTLVLWIAPAFGTSERVTQVASELAAAGIEVWHVDLAENLFLPGSTSTMRALDGRYIAGLVAHAGASTGKQVTLLSRSYGALPVLRGARQWQLRRQAGDASGAELSGAILFSPELYSEIPPLGLPPVFDPIVDATTIPLMLYQGERRNNRWQFGELVTRLRAGGAQVYTRILPGVTGLFHEDDTAPQTLATWRGIAPELARVIRLLESTGTPLVAGELAPSPPESGAALDISLQPFTGDPVPPPLDLPDVTGRQVRYDDYRGKVTVVNFWASWCGPCVEEIPALNRLRERMRDSAFELVSVDYAEDRARVKAFLEQVKVDFPVLLDSDGSTAARWGVLVFPSTFVIGPDGRVVYGVNGAIQWDSDEVVGTLRKLLDDGSRP